MTKKTRPPISFAWAEKRLSGPRLGGLERSPRGGPPGLPWALLSD